MMICKADFEELFPEIFKSKGPAATAADPLPDDGCIDRWKDGAGRYVTRPNDTGQSKRPKMFSSLSAIR